MSTIIGNPIILPSGGGTLPSLLITTETGATVTATLGSQIVTLVEIDQGQYYTELPDYGAWTVTATLNNAVSSRTIDVTAVELYQVEILLVPEDVNDATWAKISKVSQMGIGDTYWDIGDAKAITLNGTIGTKSFNTTLYVYIVHFNMPTNKTMAENNIIWQGFKSALTNGKDVALRDWTASYAYGDSKTDGTKLFNMNHWGESNHGGWKGCDLRFDILGATSTQPSGYGSAAASGRTGYDATASTLTGPRPGTVLAALPSELRAVMRLWTRYIDAVGNSSNVDANIKATVDAITLLTEFEVFGTRSYANQYEQNHQVQVDYYKNGNSKIRYAHDSAGAAKPSDAIATNGPSQCSDYANGSFCIVSNNGNANFHSSSEACGLAPAFKT